MKHPGFWFVLGLLLGLFTCWWIFVRPMAGQLKAREEAVKEWERINRSERDAIANIKTIDTESLRKWMATLDEQNTRYAALQEMLHQQELALVGPATTHLWLAVVLVLLAGGTMAWVARDGNADAARTLSSVVAILPSLQESLQEQVEAPRLVDNVIEVDSAKLISTTREGRIVSFFIEKKYGFISPKSGGDDLFFHLDQVSSTSKIGPRVGSRVSYQEGMDARNRPCARDIKVLDI